MSAHVDDAAAEASSRPSKRDCNAETFICASFAARTRAQSMPEHKSRRRRVLRQNWASNPMVPIDLACSYTVWEYCPTLLAVSCRADAHRLYRTLWCAVSVGMVPVAAPRTPASETSEYNRPGEEARPRSLRRARGDSR